MAEEKTRYTDAELEEFRQLIEEKLAAARAEFEIKTNINSKIPQTSNI